ncbi:GNAT family N-acetyltransferase [Zavarzinia compransoris]|uniref:30S ribosomal protein S5 alanine N-acetyltransferase n=1 Tax=Zavarzinia compransoris TaxID=1264899 RepID=A0A317DZI8_9PROT|nr:GNAT family protein [Zavarzinia compransoris]PWR19841.1 30S ribosomal protein S5 alanine N-acetyltransferase [Zavarzinia compransoris]TDP45050.1 [SSU ribosomal protein S5P]-alanine acetyltransferase [Zavarzinia compransoris]
MSLIRSLRLDPLPVVTTSRIELRAPVAGDFEQWSALRAESRDFLTPWEPLWPADDLTRNAFRHRLRRYAREAREDAGYTLFLFSRGEGLLLGGITLSNVRRGVTQSCALGYWMGKRYAGRGLMTEAVRGITVHVFETLRLHRIEAACLPSNQPSRAVLRRAGFSEEGMARQYLRINGQWRDHLLFAMLATDPRP